MKTDFLLPNVDVCGIIIYAELYSGSIPYGYKCSFIGSGDYHFATFLAIDTIRDGNISWMLLPRRYTHTGGFPQGGKKG